MGRTPRPPLPPLQNDGSRSPANRNLSVPQWMSSPRGLSPRAALRRLSPRASTRSSNSRSGTSKNKIAQREVSPERGAADDNSNGNGVSSASSYKVAEGPDGNARVPPASNELVGTLRVQHLRALLREDSELIAERLAQRMESVQRELLADQACHILGAVEDQLAKRMNKMPLRQVLRPSLTETIAAEQLKQEYDPARAAANKLHGADMRRNGSGHSLDSLALDTVQGYDESGNAHRASTMLSSKLDVLGTAHHFMSFLNSTESAEEAYLQRVVRKAQGFSRNWRDMEVPQGARLVDRLVRHWVFVHACGLVIFLNAMFITVSTNRELQNPGTQDQTIIYVEYFFIGWYFLELTLKLWAHGRYFFVGPEYHWNTFDFILVVFSALQVSTMTGAVQFGFLRSLRLFKISKIFRLFRFLEFMKEVKVMVYCIIHSLAAVFWSLALIVFLLFLFSVLILQAVLSFLESNLEHSEYSGSDPSMLREKAKYDNVQEKFNSVQQTMLVMFQSTTGGIDWSEPYNDLGATSWWAQTAYLCYVAFFVVAVWNIVTSIFIEKANELSTPDKEEMMMAKRRAEMDDIQELKTMMQAVDQDHSGTLAPAEFERVFHNPLFRHFLDERGIHIKEAGTFFAMVAQSVGGDAEVEIDTMIACCLRIRGLASSIDLHTLRFELKSAVLLQNRALEELRAAMAPWILPDSSRPPSKAASARGSSPPVRDRPPPVPTRRIHSKRASTSSPV